MTQSPQYPVPSAEHGRNRKVLRAMLVGLGVFFALSIVIPLLILVILEIATQLVINGS